jgi:GNAT superfamily N-acetyltransferase
VASWQEAYRGLFADEVLDDPEAIDRREQQWTTILTEERFSDLRSAVAEIDGEIVGLAQSGPVLEGTGTEVDTQLYCLYLLAAHHGSGAAQELLDAVLAPDEPAILWVADPNPRAQAFYAKNRFRADGLSLVDRGVREIRMARGR